MPPRIPTIQFTASPCETIEPEVASEREIRVEAAQASVAIGKGMNEYKPVV